MSELKFIKLKKSGCSLIKPFKTFKLDPSRFSNPEKLATQWVNLGYLQTTRQCPIRVRLTRVHSNIYDPIFTHEDFSINYRIRRFRGREKLPRYGARRFYQFFMEMWVGVVKFDGTTSIYWAKRKAYAE